MFITGHFTATYGGVDLGQTEQGWEMVEAHLTEDIVTDSGGDAPVDGVQRGTRCEVRGTYVEYDKVADALYAADPSGASRQNVGQLMTNLAYVLVLTPVPGTTAAADLGTGNSLIFHRAIVVSDITTLLSTKHRKGPITFRCYPSVMSSGLIYSIGNATTVS